MNPICLPDTGASGQVPGLSEPQPFTCEVGGVTLIYSRGPDGTMVDVLPQNYLTETDRARVFTR